MADHPGKSILIVGGGVVGLCSAYYAARKGHRVTVIERGSPAHDCCSAGNAGLVVPSHFIPLAAPGMVSMGLRMMWNPESPFYFKPRLSWDLMKWAWRFARSSTLAHVQRSAPLLRDLNLASRRAFEELASEHGNEFGLDQKGLMLLCRTRHALAEETAMAVRGRKLGLAAEILTPGEASELQPGLGMDIAGAVYFPDDCHLIPDRFLAGLTRSLEELGVIFHWSTPVTGWVPGHGSVRAARTPAGEYTADEFVLAAGSWSAEIARDLGVVLPLQAGKGYSITVPRPREMPSVPCILTEARVAVTPMGGALRFAGTMELAGLDETINERRVRGILKSIPGYFPAFSMGDFRGIQPWSGLRPCTPDGLPYVGHVKGWGNFCAATGHAMMGLSLGPVTGKLVAAMLSGEDTFLPIQALDPNRFG
jgi:D-amino-acid dehydrogenase